MPDGRSPHASQALPDLQDRDATEIGPERDDPYLSALRAGDRGYSRAEEALAFTHPRRRFEQLKIVEHGGIVGIAFVGLH